jgi:hypothetical protein
MKILITALFCSFIFILTCLGIVGGSLTNWQAIPWFLVIGTHISVLPLIIAFLAKLLKIRNLFVLLFAGMSSLIFYISTLDFTVAFLDHSIRLAEGNLRRFYWRLAFEEFIFGIFFAAIFLAFAKLIELLIQKKRAKPSNGT